MAPLSICTSAIGPLGTDLPNPMQSTTLLALTRLIGLPITLFFSMAAYSQSTAPPPPWQTFANLDERPRAQVSQDLARLLFLRPRSMQDTGAPVDVWVEGRFHTTVLPGAFSETEVCPGNRWIELASQGKTGPSAKSPFNLASLPRQTVYVLIQTKAGSATQSTLSNQQAQALLPELRRQSHAVSRVPAAQDCQALPVMKPEPVLAAASTPAAVPVPLPLPLPVPVPLPMPAVVPTPMPAPVAVPAPVVSRPAPEPAVSKYTLAAEMLFTFSGSKPQHLSEQGQTQIVRLGKRIKEQLKPGQVIVVQGHTDPMGSAELNRRLSLERAQTVSRILVNSGLPARQLRAEGLGSSELLVKDCHQVAKTRDAKLNCNRPNRRVEITVNPAKN
jgi:OOP family OmpA-OmpF porin